MRHGGWRQTTSRFPAEDIDERALVSHISRCVWRGSSDDRSSGGISSVGRWFDPTPRYQQFQ